MIILVGVKKISAGVVMQRTFVFKQNLRLNLEHQGTVGFRSGVRSVINGKFIQIFIKVPLQS
jgi:hypothetical protein